MHVHVVVILPLGDEALLADAADQRLLSISRVVHLDVITDLTLLDLLSTVVADNECVIGLLVCLEGVLALVTRTTLQALVRLVGVALGLVKSVPALLDFGPTLLTGDEFVAVLTGHVTLVDKFLMLSKVVHALEHLATLTTHKSLVGSV